MTGNLVRMPLAATRIQEYDQRLSSCIGGATLVPLGFYRFQDQRLDIRRLAAAARARYEDMLGRPCRSCNRITNDPVAAERVAGKR